MQKHHSIPIETGRERSLHLVQKCAKRAKLGLFRSLQISSPVLRIQQVASSDVAVLEVLSEGNTVPNVASDRADTKQTITVTTVDGQKLEIVLKWPKGAQLGGMHIESKNLNIKSELSISDENFLSREIIISNDSGGVSGLIPIEELLNISAGSGDVAITLMPRHDESATQSNISVKTGSGSIALNKQVDERSVGAKVHIPRRACVLSVKSGSGSIYALTGISRSTTCSSTSGNLQLRVLSSGNGDAHDKSEFTTTSSSGSQSITFLGESADTTSRQKTPQEPSDLRQGCSYSHKSSSGSINIEYPSTWQGRVEARSTSSSIKLNGDCVTVQKGPKHVEALKGIPVQQTKVRSTSGGIKLSFA